MSTDLESDWLRKEEISFQTRVLDHNFLVREILPAGGPLYDPAFGNWVEDDGSIYVLDVGGQQTRDFDPTAAHGALYRLTPANALETIVSPGRLGFRGMAMFPYRAPASFSPWEGHVFVVGQTRPGRPGAHWDHAVYKLAPGDDRYELFAVIPRCGGLNDGVPGAMLPCFFGPEGSEFEGQFLVFSIMTCIVYAVDTDGCARPVLSTDGSNGPQIMPRAFFPANRYWGDLEGELLFGGMRGGSFTSKYIPGSTIDYWVVRDGVLGEQPVSSGPGGLARSSISPATWGEWGGMEFFTDNGTTNLAQQQKFDDPLPYDAKILARDVEGNVRVFADGLRSGRNSVLFAGDRLLVCNVGKSYSTGEFHEPDGSISEIRLRAR